MGRLYTAISYAQILTVAKRGGNFRSIQSAIDSITDASSSKRYLIHVMPGLWEEQITMKSYVDIRGAGKHCTQLRFTGNDNGTVILADYVQLEDVLIEMTPTASEWAIVGDNKSHIHIRNVDILGSSGAVSQGIKITGNSWATCFIEHCVISYLGTTGYGIYIAGNSSSPQNIDTHLVDVFVDSFNATSGGSIYIKDCYAGRMRLGLLRTSSNGFNLSINRTSTGTVDFMMERVTCEYGSTSVEVNFGTSLHCRDCHIDSHSGSGTIYWWSQKMDSVSVKDTDGSHFLSIVAGSNLTANRTLTLTTGDAARTLTISGNATLNDWFDQSVKTTASPTFAAIKLTSGAGSGKVLTSDADGNASWQTPSGGSSALPTGYITGLVSSKVAGTDYDVQVSAGKCRDTSDTYDMTLSSAMTKKLNTSWAAGDNQGGLFSGSIAANTIYYMFLIRKDSDGSIDWGFDTSASAVNKPSGYSAYRCLGYVRTGSDSKIRGYIEACYGNMVDRTLTPFWEVATNLTATSYTALSLSSYIPSTFNNVQVLLTALSVSDNPTIFFSPDGSNPVLALQPPYTISDPTFYNRMRYISVKNAQVYYARQTSSGSTNVYLMGVRFSR